VDYGWQPERVGATRLFVLPSPSGQATRFWDEGPWRDLAAALRPPGP
jgi:TDG/mug DNA glycosylase family protein